MVDLSKLKPSELLELALNDLELCEKDPRYRIDMSDWHLTLTPHGVCSVCLAGAMLAKSTDWPIDETYDLFCGEHDTQVEAVDMLRNGSIGRALLHLGVISYGDEVPDGLSDVWVPNYTFQPEVFKARLRSIVQLLQEYDL